jgi:tetratricopeptide (TPR) repeat protein
MIINDHVRKNPFDEVPKAAALRIGPAAIAAQKAQGEFLGQFIGSVRLPGQNTGGDGPVSGWLAQFIVLFTDEFVLPADHYFIVPQVEILNGKGDFLWLSAPHNPPQFAGDLQQWIRNANLDPDWLRVGTDIVGGTTFNGSFSLHSAHQRGVIHRDLKPANILLTAQGVAKITDFGLAKRLEDASQTQTGAILGTPSYMAPEQAAGNPKEIGPATDVYALGAILYELLTGRPPFRARTTMETLREVQSREPLPLARWRVKVPHDLEIICLKCLEKESRKRYSSAETLADDLHRFVTGEPIKARPISPWERAAKWAKRRPALAALLGVSGLFLLSLLAVSLFYNAQLNYTNARLKDSLQRARRAVDKMLTEVAGDLADKPHMEEKEKELLEEALAIYQEFLREKGDDPAMQEETALAYKRKGDILHLLGKNDLAKDAYGHAIALLGRLADGAPTTPKYRQDLANSYNFLGEALRTTGYREGANDAYLQALELQKALVFQFPKEPAYQQELSRTNYNCGILCADKSPKDAEYFFTQAILTMEKLVGDLREVPKYQQGLARSYLNLGAVLGNTKRFQEAKEANDKAIALLENLVKNFPTNRDYRLELGVSCNNLGNSLRATKQYPEAEKAHRKAVGTLEELTRDFPHVPQFRSELANATNSLGLLLDDTFRLPAAKAAWLAARSSYEKLVVENPDVPEYRAELGRVSGNLGWLYFHPLNRQSVLLRFFENSEPRFGLAGIPGCVGWLEFERAQLGQARLHLEEGIKNLELVLSRGPENADYLDALRRQYGVLASTLGRLARYADAGRAAEDYYLAAGYLARSVPLAEKETHIPEAERKQKGKKYAEGALASLRQAIHYGFRDFDRLAKDPAFASLHRHDDFAKLSAAARP